MMSQLQEIHSCFMSHAFNLPYCLVFDRENKSYFEEMYYVRSFEEG